MRSIGTISRGIRTPIIKQGDDLVEIAATSVTEAANDGGFSLHDRDVVGITESVLARAQGNYATIAQISQDVRKKIPGGTAGVTLPILSRNRFSQILRGISGGVDELFILLAYPGDEVGNPLISWDALDEKGVNPYIDVLEEAEFIRLFGKAEHPFTGVDYISYYKELTGGKARIIFGNDPRSVLKYAKFVITADIHTRGRSKRLLAAAGAGGVFGLDDILNEPIGGSGYNPEYGLLGSNLATADSLKLFPRDAGDFAERVADRLHALTGKRIEVLVYGDGAFKDPVGGIWELADPVVSPGYTKGLEGTPNELKLKYLADTAVSGKQGDDASEAIREMIREKQGDLTGNMAAQGTTPRRYTDLLGSLCDLTSGSGDKGTPIVLIQGYFDTYADV